MEMPAQWREARRRTRRPAKMRERQREGGPRSWADGEATRTRSAAAAQALTTGRWVANLASAFTRFFLALRMERTPHPFPASRLANGEECQVLRSPAQGRPSIPLPEAPNPEAGACRCTIPANNFAAFSITPHSPGLRPLPKQQQAPLAVSSLDPTAQGHTVLPPYGSGLGRERAVFPRYYRSRPFSFTSRLKAAIANQLQERAVRLRALRAQPFVGGQNALLIVRINGGSRLERPQLLPKAVSRPDRWAP